MSSSLYLMKALKANDIDICGISEHMLLPETIDFLSSVDKNYSYLPTVDFSLHPVFPRRVGKGGVSLMWHKRWDNRVEPLQFEPPDDRIVGIKFNYNDNDTVYVLQVYLPTTRYSIDIYREYIDKLCELCTIYGSQGRVIVMGDFNGHFSGQRYYGNFNSRDRFLQQLLNDCSLFCVTTSTLCSGEMWSYVPDGYGSPSLIDHMLIPNTLSDCVKECVIIDDDSLDVSNHRPIKLSMFMSDLSLIDESVQEHPRVQYKWKCADMYAYKYTLDELLYHCLPESATSDNLDVFYKTFIDSLLHSSSENVPIAKFKPYLKPYWNDELKTLHKDMRQARLVWISEGKPRGQQFPSYVLYKNAKQLFRCKKRQFEDDYILEEFEKIDKAAEVDQTSFWKLLNSKRCKSRSAAGSEIKFEHETLRDPRAIVDGWGDYFQKLYNMTDSSNFDVEHKHKVEHLLNEVLQRNENDKQDYVDLLNDEFSMSELSEVLKSLPNGKAAGIDFVTYEHLKYAGPYALRCLLELFNAFVKFETIPSACKLGLIITLYKGSGKPKDCPDSYRAISLQPVIEKVFEKLLLKRIEDSGFNHKINPLQNGFQKQMNSTMASFTVKECISYAKQHDSKVFAAFMDAEKAFDRVWHTGLFYQLYEFGIRGRCLRLIMELYKQMSAQVLYKGLLSKGFEIHCGTRQGGILSPWFYLVYINPLLNCLSSAQGGFSMFNHSFCCPTQADDIVLLSLSKSGLDELLEICCDYGRKWRFNYNSAKCKIVVFNEKKTDFQNQNRSWNLGSDHIGEVEEYKHVGIHLNKYNHSNIDVDCITHKIRGSYFSLMEIGIHNDYLHPLTSLKVYKSVVLPRALFGSELWTSLTSTALKRLETVHHYCLKRIQDLNMRTRTDMVLGLLGMLSIEELIDKRKLCFFGSLCRLSNHTAVKQLFLIRFFQVRYKCSDLADGFIQNILNILAKYELTYVAEDYLMSGVTLPKVQWKRLVTSAVFNKHKNDWIQRMSVAEDFIRFKMIHDELESCVWWRISRHCLHLKRGCSMMIKLCCVLPHSNIKCVKCQMDNIDIVKHVIFYCNDDSVNSMRHSYWNMLTDKFGVRLFVFLDQLDEETLTIILLGGLKERLLDGLMVNEVNDFYAFNCTHLVKLFDGQHLNPLY